MSSSKIKKKFDKVLELVQERLGNEIGGLMGATLVMSDLSMELISKEDFFEEPSGKIVCSEMELSGEIEGEGCIIVSVKDAIRLGGTLIMLPENELDEASAAEDYSEEIDDSYGEIANLIAGAYTSTFEEMYPKNFRFIRKDLEVLSPLKVDVESDKPIPNQNYYKVSAAMNLNGVEMGNLVLLMPAAALGLDDEAAAPAAANAEDSSATPSVEGSDDAVDGESSAAANNDDVESQSQNVAETVTEEAAVPENKAPVLDKAAVEKNKKKFDKIIEIVQERVADEVGGLMGATMVMSDLSMRLISKEDFFEEPSGKLICAEMQLSGEIEGDGCIIVSVKDAIRLGGTLIMLPESELDESSAAEDYSEEIDDSYGEIANIIAGAYTSTFEEMYPKKFRFIRKNHEILIPIKVDIESDKPVPNQNYYQVSAKMTLNSVEMGNLILLIPAEPLGLNIPDEPEPEESPSVATASASAANVEESAEASGAAKETAAPQAKSIDIKKQKKRVDACLKECNVRMADEVSAILGADVSFTDHETRLVNKEDFFFDEASGKQILAHMDVVGEIDGNAYMYVGLKDAIYIGGTLIMLPPTELDLIVAEEEFGDDSEDAYGEIANIISGVYTKVFEEQYPEKVRFIKTKLEQVVPMKVDAESDEPMPDVLYYMATSTLNIGDKALGNMQMLVPANLLKLETLGQAEAADDAPEEGSAGSSVTGKAGAADSSGGVGVREGGSTAQNPEFLIVSNNGEECSKITAVLNSRGVSYKVLDYKESASDYLPGEVKAIFLVMDEVDEKGLGVAIKISSASALPLIAVGAPWTRTKVIKAVKYGVDDILLTPASDSDIAEKIDSVSAQKAA